MSRTYALALIFAAITLVSGLFYAQYRYLTDGQTEVAVYAAEVHERVVAGQLAEMERLAYLAEERMQEDSKEKFRPILLFVSNAFERRDAYLDRAETDKGKPDADLASFSRFHNTELDSLATAYTAFLREFGRQMDLRLEDINAKAARVDKAINRVRFVPGDAMYSTSGKSLTKRLLALDYLEVVGLVVNDVIEISGGKAILCSFGPEFFPIMVTNIENPRRGETVKAKIWAGSYFTSLNTDNIVLLIDKDTLKINPDGRADYIFTPKKRGKLEFNLELGVINPLTGHITRSKEKRAFNIR